MRIYSNALKHVRIYENISKRIKVCQDVSKYIKIVFKHVDTSIHNGASS